MPRNPTTGVFTRVDNSFSEPVANTVIDPADAIQLFDDYDVALNTSIPLTPGSILIGQTGAPPAEVVPTGDVTISEAGVTTITPGAVTKADVGLGNVDNTSDADKPVSTAQANALALKAPLASPAFTGVPTAPTAGPGTNTDQIATTAFVLANGSGSSEVFYIKDYGAVGNGVTDDTAAAQAWIAAINASTAPNVTAMLGDGNYPLASASVPNGLAITRNRVIIDGNGATITVTGASVVKAVFNTDGMSDITYRNIRFIGNSQADAFANGAAIWFVAYTTGNCSGLLVDHCFFQNFKGDYWVFAENIGTRAITDVVIRNNFAVSQTGNARGPTTITIASSFCGVFGSGDLNHLLTEVLIENNVVYADYIKNGVIVQNQVQNFTIQNNTIWNAGQIGVSNDCGAYAIMIYANVPFTPGKYGRTTGNKILSPRSIGIYQANIWPGSIIADNFITGQGPDTLNVTLPKGGIVLNGSYETTVTGNIIVGTTKDAIWCNTSPNAHTGLNISNNTIRTAERGIVFESATYSGSNIVIQDNLLRDVVRGIVCRSYTGVTTVDITVRNNQMQLTAGASVGIEFDSPTSTYQLFYCNIQGNTIRAGSAGNIGIKFESFPNTASFIRQNTLFGTFSSGVVTTGSTLLTTDNNLTQA